MMTIQQRYERIGFEYSTNEQLLKSICMIQSWVRIAYPNATKLVTTAENGNPTHIGIYDVALTLNSRGYFRPLDQPAPQLLGELIQIGSSIHRTLDKRVELITELSCWFTALDHAIRLCDSYVITMPDYLATFDHKHRTYSLEKLN